MKLLKLMKMMKKFVKIKMCYKCVFIITLLIYWNIIYILFFKLKMFDFNLNNKQIKKKRTPLLTN